MTQYDFQDLGSWGRLSALIHQQHPDENINNAEMKSPNIFGDPKTNIQGGVRLFVQETDFTLFAM